jgi:hypothetical protein
MAPSPSHIHDCWATFKVEVTLQLTVSMAWCRAHSGTCDQIFLSESCSLLSVGWLIWWEDRSAICSAITQWSESHRICNHALLSHLKLPQPGRPGSHIYIPQEQGGPVIPPCTVFPFHRLLWLTGLQWRYSNLPPHGMLSHKFKVTLRQSVCLNVEHPLGLVTLYYFLSVCCCLKFAVLFLWGALSEERTGLQFAVHSLNGPSHAEPITILYCLIWDSPNLESQVPVFISPRNGLAQLYPRALGSLYVASCDSQGYGGGILTLPQPGGPGPRIYIYIYISLRNRMVQSKSCYDRRPST